MDESNFFVDTEENMCTLDFEDVGLTPQSFASYTMSTSDSCFASEVAKYSDRSASQLIFDGQGWCNFDDINRYDPWHGWSLRLQTPV